MGELQLRMGTEFSKQLPSQPEYTSIVTVISALVIGSFLTLSLITPTMLSSELLCSYSYFSLPQFFVDEDNRIFSCGFLIFHSFSVVDWLIVTLLFSDFSTEPGDVF